MHFEHFGFVDRFEPAKCIFDIDSPARWYRAWFNQLPQDYSSTVIQNGQGMPRLENQELGYQMGSLWLPWRHPVWWRQATNTLGLFLFQWNVLLLYHKSSSLSSKLNLYFTEINFGYKYAFPCKLSFFYSLFWSVFKIEICFSRWSDERIFTKLISVTYIFSHLL